MHVSVDNMQALTVCRFNSHFLHDIPSFLEFGEQGVVSFLTVLCNRLFTAGIFIEMEGRQL